MEKHLLKELLLLTTGVRRYDRHWDQLLLDQENEDNNLSDEMDDDLSDDDF